MSTYNVKAVFQREAGALTPKEALQSLRLNTAELRTSAEVTCLQSGSDVFEQLEDDYSGGARLTYTFQMEASSKAAVKLFLSNFHPQAVWVWAAEHGPSLAEQSPVSYSTLWKGRTDVCS